MSALLEEDRQLIEEAAERFVLDNYPFEDREKRREANGPYGANWETFAELGWLALPYGEAAGGLGGGVADVQSLARALGPGLIDEPFVEVALLAGKVIEFSATEDRLEDLLGPVMMGERVPVFAHGEQRADINFAAVETTAEQSAEGYSLTGTKRVVNQAGAADSILVSALLDGEPAIFLVPRDAANMTITEYPTIDGRLAADIALSAVELAGDALIASGSDAADGVRRAIMFCISALAGELQGIADVVVKTTAEYLNTREQFGTAIGGFQALQHMLANMVIAQEEIKSLAWLTATASEGDDIDQQEQLVRSAKARLGEVSRNLVEIGIQLHGGIGVTDEYVISHYLRRAIAVDAMFGDSQQQLRWLADQV